MALLHVEVARRKCSSLLLLLCTALWEVFAPDFQGQLHGHLIRAWCH